MQALFYIDYKIFSGHHLAMNKLAKWMAAQKPPLTVRAFAGMLKVNHSKVHRWKVGKTPPSIADAVKIKEITKGKVKPDDFLPKEGGV